MSTFYIAGPMDGYPQRNYPAFHKAGEELKKNDIEVLSPAHDEFGRPLKPPHPDEEHLWKEHLHLWQEQLRESLKKLLLCDGVYMLKGWETSPGAGLEYRTALTLGMTITVQYQGLEENQHE